MPLTRRSRKKVESAVMGCLNSIVPPLKSLLPVFVFPLSLIDVESTTSFMIHTIQVVHSQADKLRIAKEKAKRKAAKKRLQDGGKPL